MVAVFCVLAPWSLPRTTWAQGSPLGPEFRVNTYTTLQQGGPSVATDGAGNFVVVWSSGNPTANETEVFGQRYASSGVPLGPQFQVNTYTTGMQAEPRVASNAAGDFVVVWGSRAQGPPVSSPFIVFGQRYAATGAPLGAEFRVNTMTTTDQSSPAVASDSAGNFVVVFSRFDGSFGGIFGQRYASTGPPLGSEFRVNTNTADIQAAPAVTSDAAGNLVAVWQSRQQDGDNFGIFGQRYASTGAPLGPEFRVNTHITYSQQTPSVATAGSAFVVVWSSYNQDGSDYGVFGQRYSASGPPQGGEFRVNTFVPNAQYQADVAADTAGNFVVVWSSLYQDGPPGPGGGGSGVFGQRYASTGAPSGPEFRVNTVTSGSQYAASAAAEPAGSFVVVWASIDPFGDIDVFGQRFGPIVPVELMRFHIE